MYITVHRAGSPLSVKPLIGHCIATSPQISSFKVCNGHVIGRAAPQAGHHIDANRGLPSSITRPHDLLRPGCGVCLRRGKGAAGPLEHRGRALHPAARRPPHRPLRCVLRARPGRLRRVLPGLAALVLRPPPPQRPATPSSAGDRPGSTPGTPGSSPSSPSPPPSWSSPTPAPSPGCRQIPGSSPTCVTSPRPTSPCSSSGSMP